MTETTATRTLRTPNLRRNALAGGLTGAYPLPIRSVSVVVACRNESKYIRQFLDSFMGQDLEGMDWELIIADGASHDGTGEIVAEFACTNPRVRFMQNPARIVATGLNAAIRAARGEFILRMDAHSEYMPNYVKTCVATLENTDAQNVGGPARTRADGLQARAIQAAYHSRFSTGGARFHEDSYTGYVDTVPYGCWRKETLLRLGLFDEQLVRNQDDELNLRLIRAGGKIWQSSEIVSWYRPRTELSSLFRQYFQYGFWKVCVIRKHRIPASWRHLIPGAFVLANILILLTALGLAIGGQRTEAEKVFFVGLILLMIYALGCLIAATFAARRFGWELFLHLPVTFMVFHFSYGLGFLAGMAYWPFFGTEHSRLGNIFEGDTR